MGQRFLKKFARENFAKKDFEETIMRQNFLTVRLTIEIANFVLYFKAGVLEFGYATSGPDGPKDFEETRGEKNLVEKNVCNLERKKSLSVRLATEISYFLLDF